VLRPAAGHAAPRVNTAGAAGDGLPQLRSSVGNAFHSVRFKFDRLGCASNIHLQLHLCDAIVNATALSSCEVWDVHPAAQQQRRKLAAQHRGYVRSICRLPTGVPTEALMAELGRTDIEAWWLAHSLRFWNSLCAQPRGSLHYELLIDAQSEALLVALGTGCGGCGEGAKGWGMSCRSARSERGASTCNMCLACGQRSSSGHGRPSACALGHAGPRVQLSARTLSFPARRGSRCTCGFSGSGTRRGASAAIYVSSGCSTLPVVMGRRDHTPRHRRHCQQCDPAVVGDERHMIVECPAVQHIRDRNPDLFWDGQSRREFVNQADQVAVVDFIVACFDSFVQTDQLSSEGVHPVTGTLLAPQGLTECNTYIYLSLNTNRVIDGEAAVFDCARVARCKTTTVLQCSFRSDILQQADRNLL